MLSNSFMFRMHEIAKYKNLFFYCDLFFLGKINNIDKLISWIIVVKNIIR